MEVNAANHRVQFAIVRLSATKTTKGGQLIAFFITKN
jgi:hypothetical protein